MLLFLALFNFQDTDFRFTHFRETAYLLYHSFFFLSSTFRKFLKKLFPKPKLAFLALAFSKAALILYHNSFALSIPFLKFFKVFCRDLSFLGSSRCDYYIIAL